MHVTSADSACDLRAELDRLIADFERCLAEVLSAAARARIGAADVRADLIVIERAYSQRLAILERSLERSTDDVTRDRAWTFRHRRLADVIRVEVAAYIQRMAPRPSTASVFAAAARRAQARPTAPVAEPDAVDMRTCTTCGAPRVVGALYGNCAHCGAPLFP